jgi:hypothetical protein
MGLPVIMDFPKSPEAKVLHNEGLVQAHSLPQSLYRLFRGVIAQSGHSRIAGDDPHDQKDQCENGQ